VANIYDATITANTTFALQAENSTVNIYGGLIENKTSTAGTFTIRHNNHIKGTILGAVNVYGGTIIANVGACIGAGESGTDGQVNIYGGTFIKTGEASTYGLLGHYNNGSADKNYYIYGGTFITKSTNDPQAYRYAKSSDIAKPLNCSGVLNRAYDSVKAITVTKDTAAKYGIDWEYDGYADVCVITPNGTDLKCDMFGNAHYQIKQGVTTTTASTDVRIIVEVSKDIVNNAAYNNIGFTVSLTNGNPTEGTQTKVVSATLVEPMVYSAIKENGNYLFKAPNGYCFAVIDIKNIANSSFDDFIYVRPYLVGADGNMYYGEAASIRIIDAIE
jgi:hypothetical protein